MKNKKMIYIIIALLIVLAIGCVIIHVRNNREAVENQQDTSENASEEKEEDVSKDDTVSEETSKSKKKKAKKKSVETVEDTSSEVQGITGDGDILLKTSHEELETAGFEPGDVVSVHVENKDDYIEIPYSTRYEPGGETALVSFEGKDTSVVANPKDVSVDDDGWTGASAVISLKEKGGRMDVVSTADNSGDNGNNGDWSYSASRDDYDSDEQFANAREVTLGDIKPGRLYRSASIFCNQCNRAPYASDYAKANNIATFLDLEDIKDISQYKDIPEYAKEQYDKGNIILGGTGDFFNYSEENGEASFNDSSNEAVKNALIELSKRDTPYLIFGIEGKDRTGFVCAVLEALGNATWSEIIDDYMASFANYYKISEESDPEMWMTIRQQNVMPVIRYLQGDGGDNKDPHTAAYNYLNGIGMSDEDIDRLYNKLCK